MSRRLGTGHVTRAKVCDFGGKEVHEKTTKPSTLRVPGKKPLVRVPTFLLQNIVEQGGVGVTLCFIPIIDTCRVPVAVTWNRADKRQSPGLRPSLLDSVCRIWPQGLRICAHTRKV